MQAVTATARAAKSRKYGTEDRARNWVGQDGLSGIDGYRFWQHCQKRFQAHLCGITGFSRISASIMESLCSYVLSVSKHNPLWEERNILDISLLTNLSKAVAKIKFDEFTEPGSVEKWSSGNVAKSLNLSANSPKG